ncbi:MAG: biotin/lipoyl-containing protein [Sodaliphilus sp.]|nr:biotin/lipoyl-binding protein [Bacteroidales bacterium]MDY4075924.1 biotin/lipoyl-containing protein [Sodaliphilus sp.]
MKEFKFKISGQDYSATVAEENAGSLVVTVNGQAYQVEVPQTKAAAPVMARGNAGAAQAGGPKNINSELPGTVTKIVAANGQRVKKGDVLLVIEAMKMANDIVSDVEGTVQRIAVTEGQSVNQGDLLVEMVADAVAAPAAAAAPAPKAAPAAAPAPAAPKVAAGAKVVEAPLPGTITKVLVKPGQALKAGETVCMMEAMKMENSITVEFAGTVKSVLVEVGAQVQSGQALVELA